MYIQGGDLFDYGFSSAIACFVIRSYLLLNMFANRILILLCCDFARYMLRARRFSCFSVLVSYVRIARWKADVRKSECAKWLLRSGRQVQKSNWCLVSVRSTRVRFEKR